MQCTIASVVGLAAMVLVALAMWPDNLANPVLDRAMAQASATQRSEIKQERHLFRLQHVNCANLAGTLTKAFPSGDGTTVVAVADPSINSVLVSAPPEAIKEISNLITELDSPQPAIAVEVWFVNLQPETPVHGDIHKPSAPTEFLQSGRRPAVLNQLHQLETDGKAVVTNHFQLTCMDNQLALAQQGERRTGTTNTTATNSNRTSTHENVGTLVQVQARVSSRNEIIAAIDAEKSTAAPEAKDGSVEPAARTAERSEPTPTKIAILGQSTIRIASGDIANLTGVECMPDEAAGSYQILVSAEVLPQGSAEK